MDLSQDHIVAYYDEFYRGEGFSYYPPSVTREILEVLLRKTGVRPGARILDVGCATGYYSGILAAMGYEVTGIDISATGIGKARELYPHLRFEVMDATRMTFEEASFDLVFALGVSVANTRDMKRLHEFIAHLQHFAAPGGAVLFLGGSTLSGCAAEGSSWHNHTWEEIRQFPPLGLGRIRGPWLSHFRLMPLLGPHLSMNAAMTQALRLFGGSIQRRVVMVVERGARADANRAG
jgi:SAM-dependent methyltransferase